MLYQIDKNSLNDEFSRRIELLNGKLMKTISPNLDIRPATTTINELSHLVIGGCDTVDLVSKFGSPLWVVDEDTIRLSAKACFDGLSAYPDVRVCYAGKAFLCTAMCKLIQELNLSLDVVSGGELFTALQAGFPVERIFMHGNNKSAHEIRAAVKAGVTIVADNCFELDLIATIAREENGRVNVLLRVTPGVEPETHHYIKTGQNDSKFGIPLDNVPEAVKKCLSLKDVITLKGLHAHIGSQTHKIEPYLAIVDILADAYVQIKNEFGISLPSLDVGGGLGIAYTESDKPMSIDLWAELIAKKTRDAFTQRKLTLPQLAIEPGRCIVGTAGVSLYKAGHMKTLPNGAQYLSLDGGMADNPRPITYQAKYTAAIASRMDSTKRENPISLVGKYCESGDIIVKETDISAQPGDIIAIFGTGAYNYSMSSNYNRTGRPACVLVKDGQADTILERETLEDLIKHDRIPARFLAKAR